MSAKLNRHGGIFYIGLNFLTMHEFLPCTFSVLDIIDFLQFSFVLITICDHMQ